MTSPTDAVASPLVSVVIPTYQRGDIVGRAALSVLRQKVNHIEVIIVDDGSTDCTGPICSEISDPRLRYVASEHVGAAAARNIGARLARASWLTFLDSDDTASSDWLTSMLDRTGDSHTALVSCGFNERNEGSTILLRQQLPHRASPAVGPIVELMQTGGTYLVRRDLFLDVGGFDPEQQSSQHLELSLRLGPELVRRGLQACAVMRPLVDRWVGRDDHIRADDKAIFAGCARIIDQHGDRLAHDTKLLANIGATAAYRAVRLGEIREARRYMFLAVRARPSDLRHWARLCSLAVPSLARRRVLRSRPHKVA
jgi:glycosyltransferase involved in cell wall biosynthesis